MALLIPAPRPILLARWLVALGCTAAPAAAQGEPEALEQQVKAAYLLNFTRYVEWPRGTFTSADAPVDLCVVGDERFAEVVRQTIAGRRSQGRPVRLVRPDAPAQARDCHVAFVAGPAHSLQSWMTALARAPVLTVGEGTGFLRRGGMIAFVIVEETVRFEIDDAAARRARLQISSRVLALATRRQSPAESR